MEDNPDLDARLQSLEAKVDRLLELFARYEPLVKRFTSNPVASFLKGGPWTGK